jgi:hypothetical protein
MEQPDLTDLTEMELLQFATLNAAQADFFVLQGPHCTQLELEQEVVTQEDSRTRVPARVPTATTDPTATTEHQHPDSAYGVEVGPRASFAGVGAALVRNGASAGAGAGAGAAVGGGWASGGSASASGDAGAWAGAGAGGSSASQGKALAKHAFAESLPFDFATKAAAAGMYTEGAPLVMPPIPTLEEAPHETYEAPHETYEAPHEARGVRPNMAEASTEGGGPRARHAGQDDDYFDALADSPHHLPHPFSSPTLLTHFPHHLHTQTLQPHHPGRLLPPPPHSTSHPRQPKCTTARFITG